MEDRGARVLAAQDAERSETTVDVELAPGSELALECGNLRLVVRAAGPGLAKARRSRRAGLRRVG